MVDSTTSSDIKPWKINLLYDGKCSLCTKVRGCEEERIGGVVAQPGILRVVKRLTAVVVIARWYVVLLMVLSP